MAVYTPLDDRLIADILRQYDIGTLVHAAPIAEGIENTNYKITTSRADFILTVFEKRVAADDLPYFLRVMAHMHEKDMPVAQVIRSLAGDEIIQVAGKPAMISSFLSGTSRREPAAADCAAMGEMTARMHNAAADFTPQRNNTMGIDAWEQLILQCGTRADRVMTGISALLTDEIRFLRAKMPQNFSRGTVHNDLFPDNVFFDGTNISGVIDFYFTATDFYLYDLMLAFNPWCCTPAPDREKMSSFLSGYHRLRPLTDAEYATLPVFGRAAAVRIIATRLYDLLHPATNALVTPKDPIEHIRILMFHRQAASGADYGFIR